MLRYRKILETGEHGKTEDTENPGISEPDIRGNRRIRETEGYENMETRRYGKMEDTGNAKILEPDTRGYRKVEDTVKIGGYRKTEEYHKRRRKERADGNVEDI
jgi:hypothetical protein